MLVVKHENIMFTSALCVRELQYSPEELLGMMLNYSRGLAQDFAGRSAGLAKYLPAQHVSVVLICAFAQLLPEQPIKDAVITVPVFFNQAERRTVLLAAQMAGLKVLQLINDNTAVALNYGVFRRKDIDNTAKVLIQHYSPLPVLKESFSKMFFTKRERGEKCMNMNSMYFYIIIIYLTVFVLYNVCNRY